MSRVVSVLFHPGTLDLPPILIGDGYPAAFSMSAAVNFKVHSCSDMAAADRLGSRADRNVSVWFGIGGLGLGQPTTGANVDVGQLDNMVFNRANSSPITGAAVP